MHRAISCWQADGMQQIWDAPKSSADATSPDLDTVLLLAANAGKCMCSQGAPNCSPGHIHLTLQPLQEGVGFPLAPGDDEPTSTTPTRAEPGFSSPHVWKNPSLKLWNASIFPCNIPRRAQMLPKQVYSSVQAMLCKPGVLGT